MTASGKAVAQGARTNADNAPCGPQDGRVTAPAVSVDHPHTGPQKSPRRAPKPPRISEADFTRTAIGNDRYPGAAVALGYDRRWHQLNSHGTQHGLPDWILVRTQPWMGMPPRVVFLELKASDGQPTLEQQAAIEGLTAAGAEARMMWPDQVEDLIAWLKGDEHATTT